MNEQNISNQQQAAITDFYVPDTGKIELLKSILESQYGRSVTFDEAQEVGIQLISLYECLAHERMILTGDKNECS